MPRLFVAALPDEPTTAALRTLPRPDEPGVRWVPEANWHVTLRFIGDAEVDEVVAPLDGLDGACARAELGPAVAWLGSHLVVPVGGLDDLAVAVRSATAGIGATARQRFVGHLTIARTQPGVTSSVVGTPIRIGFDVDEIALVVSDLRPDGVAYTTLRTFPLRAV
jgi:2'-5' RNA ligase